jgi:hypothetical protein
MTGTRDLVIHLLAHCGPPFSGCMRLFSRCERLDDSPSHLQHYINRRVGVKLPQHLLLLHCYAAEKFDHSRSLFIVFSIRASSWFSFVIRGSFSKIAKSHQLRQNRKKFSIKWPECVQLLESHDGEEAKAAETAPISEVMKQSRLVVTKGSSDEGAPAIEVEQADIEEGNANEEEVDYNTVIPSKPSHLDFGKSTVSEADMPMMIKLGYFREAEKRLIRFGGEETTPKPENDEVVVFRSFFKAGLMFPLHEMIEDVLEDFEIYLHQLNPNAIVRLSVFIWALRSQGVDPLAKTFYRVHELHYQTKAREDGLHENFGCYNFAYRKDMKILVINYRTEWPTGWKNEWFYVKVDEKKEKIIQSPLDLTFGLTRPLCDMLQGSPCREAVGEFRVVSEHIGTRDLVQEYLTNRVFLTLKEWNMPKLKGEKKKNELVRLPYHFKFKKHFKEPC